MAGLFHRVMAIPTIQFQLTGVQFVTERNGLFRLVADVYHAWMYSSEQTGCQISGNACPTKDHHHSELVNPGWKIKLLHNVPIAVSFKAVAEKSSFNWL